MTERTIRTRSSTGDTRVLKNGFSNWNAFEELFMELVLARDFKELLKLFNQHKVKYLLIGGYAVSIHGFVRATNDIDLAVSNDPENAGRIVAALVEFGFDAESISEELFTKGKQVVRMGVEPIKIEILNYLEGPGFANAHKRRKTVDIEDIKVDVISLEDLYTNKAAVGRQQDMADIEKLKERN